MRRPVQNRTDRPVLAGSFFMWARVGGDKGTHDKHLSVLGYKKERRAKEIAALETVKVEKTHKQTQHSVDIRR